MADSTRTMEKKLSLTDLLSSVMLQEIQDAFSSATGVASIITQPDGTPITKPSNFCRLCNDIIRKTPKGLINCISSDAMVGRQNLGGPIMQPCLSVGLWTGGVSISAGERHIGSWLIGQVRDDSLDLDNLLAYAREIGADEEECRAALDEVPIMTKEQFTHVCQTLFLIANQLSLLAMQNLQQAENIAELERAENALTKAEARFRDIAFSSADWIWETDKNGTYTYASGRVKELLGLEPGEIIGKTPFDFMPPEEAERVGKILREIIARKKPIVDMENWNLTRDGKRICLLTSGVPVFGPNNELLGYRGLDKDITGRKLAEESLREKQYIIESASSVIATADIWGKMTYVNPAFLRTWGFDHAGEVIGNHFSEYWMIGQILDEIMQALRDKGEWSSDIKARKKDGSLFDVQVSASTVYDKKGNPISLMSSSIDITARLQAEEALRESEEKYRNLVEMAKDGIMIVQDGILKYVNPQLARMAGYTVEELTGNSMAQYIHSSESAKVMDRYKRRMAGEEVEPVYCTAAKHRDGRRIEVEVHASLIPYQGRPADLVLVRDATQRKRSEEERVQREKLESVIETAGAVCHQLNQPLHIIMGNIELLAMNPDDTKMQDRFDIIMHEAKRMAQITNKLERITRYETRDYVNGLKILDIDKSSE